jgi:hypothetical protein
VTPDTGAQPGDLSTADASGPRELLPGTGWQPAWQSEAAVELGNSEVRTDGSAWGDVPVRTAYAAAAVFLLTATDCLRAIADSVNVLTATCMSGVLARAVSGPRRPVPSVVAASCPARCARHR